MSTATPVLVERVHVPLGMLRNIKAHAIESDFEVCGLLGGEGSYVTHLARCSNQAMEPRHAFLVPPHQQFKALQAFEKARVRHVGVYHSHPTGEARPSMADLAVIPSEMLSLIYGKREDRITAWRGETQVDLEVIR